MKQKSSIVGLLLMVFMVFGIMFVEEEFAAAENKRSTSGNSFSDVTTQDPNYIFIKYTAQQGIINGFPDGSYHPQEGISRAQAAVVICKAAGVQVPKAENSQFKDVPINHWAMNYIDAAQKAGYIGGFPDGNYRPEAPLTRAQGISLVMRLCTQKEQAPLPVLNDLSSNHWAAANMGTALALNMIGLSADGKNIYPDTEMRRGALARALAILFTRDPQLNQVNLEGKLSEITGQVTIIRQGKNQTASNGLSIMEGDEIETGTGSSVRVNYPDGSSNLIEANSTMVVKRSDGCRYIKKDGSQGIAVDYLEMTLKEGTIFGALAARREGAKEPGIPGDVEKIEYSPTSQQGSRLAALSDFGYLAAAANDDREQPWYQTAEKKKVKVKVDMPWGVAAIRGTFIKITVNPDKTCRVSCLTGSADLTGQTGTSITLTGNDTANVSQEQASASKDSALNSEDKNSFAETKVQVFLMDASVEQEVNQSADIGQEVVSEQITQGQENTVQAVIQALEDMGITLTGSAVAELQAKVAEVLSKGDVTLAGQLQEQVSEVGNTQPTPVVNTNRQSNSGSGNTPLATAPVSFHLSKGDANPVGGLVDVSPPQGTTDNTGLVHGWISSSADTIKFTVTDSGAAQSAITINGAAYLSGADYKITAASPLTIVVTTRENGFATVVRTFVVNVLAPSSAKQITNSLNGTVVDGNVAAIPATTVGAFKAGLTLSDYATAEILAASGGSVVSDQAGTDVTTAMVIQVTAEDGTIAEYEIFDYAVANLDELYGAVTSGQAARYILAADLDFNNPSSYASGSTNQAVWTSGYGWKPPAGNFIGVFEGNRHSISNLYIAYDQDAVGLFPIVENGAVIKNLAVLDADVGNVVGDNQRFGVLAGYLGDGSIADCYCSGSINSIGAVGGIVGHTNGAANVLRCKSEVDVTGYWGVGGIVGRIDTGGTIQDCCSTGDITCFRECAGGIVGIVGNNGTPGFVGNSYATGAVSADRVVGGIAGANHGIVNNCLALNSRVFIRPGSENIVGRVCGGNTGTIMNSYALSGMVIAPDSGHTGYDGNGAISLANARSKASYSGFMAWDIDDVGSSSTSAWVIDDGKGLPQLRWHYQPGSSKKILATAYGTLVEGKLAGIPASTKVSALKAGLVVSAYASAEVLDAPGGSPVTDPATTDVTSSMAVRVTAEDGSKAEYVIYDAAIMYLEDIYNIPDVSKLRYILARDLDFDADASYASPAVNKSAWTSGSGWARNMYFKGLLEGNGHSISNLYINNNAGGMGLFLSVNETAIIKNLRLLDVDIKGGTSDRYGAISGHFSGTSIINCYASGRIYNPGGGAAGGLVGHSDSGTIIGCRSDVNVTGAWGAGGLVGRNRGASLQDCSSYGNVTCQTENAGGLVGWNESGSVIRSFAAGIISGPKQVGGLIGYNQAVVNGCFALNSKIMIDTGAEVSIGHISGNTGGTCSDCYYLTDMVMTPATGTSGSDGAGAVNLSGTKQANTYSAKGWEIAGIGGASTSLWAINEGNNYPDLSWHSRLSSAKGIFATNIGTLAGGNITAVPAGTKVIDLKRGLSVSKYASLEILDSSGGSPVADQATTDVTTSMVIRVTAQDGSEAEYTITVL